MATLKFNGSSYTVDHAVKGSNYIHGYDSAGIKIVGFEGVVDFSPFQYDAQYLSPESCLEDPNNSVKFHDNRLMRPNGQTVSTSFYTEVTVPNTGWTRANTAYRLYISGIDGLLSTDTPIVDVVTTQADVDANKLTLEAWSHIVTITTAGDGGINIFTDGEIPAVSFNIKILVVR